MDKEILEFPVILSHEKTTEYGLSPAVKEKIEELYSEGLSFSQIASELNVTVRRVSYYCNKNRLPLAARLLKKQIVSIVQECEIKSAVIGGKSKSIQINAPIQLIGDKAIDAAFGDKPNPGSLIEAMDYLLDHLPEPKLENLRALAIGAAIRRHRQLNPAAAELGISGRAIRYLKDRAVDLGMPIDDYLGSLYWKYVTPKKKKN